MSDRDALFREIGDCLDEALALQSRLLDLTERVHAAAGMSTADRALRGRVTGLFFGVLAHVEALTRLAREET
ncbi:MAG TPA: hypothetical protein VGW35_03670 [Methylomirabilota bacterium]|jgi:hypothetical protein|nr:hypothetical protein [Methylomirabilota bacterium]HEV8676080.1 hypothetical protein [Methylomirabilota bacterium]